MYARGQRGYEYQRYRQRRSQETSSPKKMDFATKTIVRLTACIIILVIVTVLSRINIPFVQKTVGSISYYLKFSNDFKEWYNNAYHYVLEKTTNPEDGAAEIQIETEVENSTETTQKDHDTKNQEIENQDSSE